MAEVTDVLNAAADLLEKPGAWTQGEAARNDNGLRTWSDCKDAVCWCVVGALNRTSNYAPEAASRTFKAANGIDDIVRWNDAPGRTQAEVVAALRSAAQSSGAEG